METVYIWFYTHTTDAARRIMSLLRSVRSLPRLYAIHHSQIMQHSVSLSSFDIYDPNALIWMLIAKIKFADAVCNKTLDIVHYTKYLDTGDEAGENNVIPTKYDLQANEVNSIHVWAHH